MAWGLSANKHQGAGLPQNAHKIDCVHYDQAAKNLLSHCVLSRSLSTDQSLVFIQCQHEKSKNLEMQDPDQLNYPSFHADKELIRIRLFFNLFSCYLSVNLATRSRKIYLKAIMLLGFNFFFKFRSI